MEIIHIKWQLISFVDSIYGMDNWTVCDVSDVINIIRRYYVIFDIDFFTILLFLEFLGLIHIPKFTMEVDGIIVAEYATLYWLMYPYRWELTHISIRKSIAY